MIPVRLEYAVISMEGWTWIDLRRNVPVIEFMWHTPLAGSVSFDINIVSNSVGLHESRELDHTTLYMDEREEQKINAIKMQK